MKRKLIILLSFILILMSINATSFVFAQNTNDTKVFLPENFTIPEDYIFVSGSGKEISCGWAKFNTDGVNNNGISEWGDKGGLYEHYLCSKKGAWFAEKPCTADFYVPETDEYYIWALSFRNMDTIAENRHCRIGFDGEYDSALFQKGGNGKGANAKPESAGFKWVKGNDSYELQKGWHSINVKAPVVVAGVNMVCITTDPDLILDENTTFEEIEEYTDIEKPILNGEIITEYVDPTTMNIKFPEASDNKGVFAKQKYTVDDEEIFPNSDDYTLSDVTPLKKIRIAAEITDCFGNSARKDIVVPMAKVIGNYIHFSMNGHKITDITSLGEGGKVKAVVPIEAIYGDEMPVKIGFGIYDYSGTRMIDFAWKETSITGGETRIESEQLVIPEEVVNSPADFSLKLFVWDLINKETVIPGITLKEER